MDCLCCSGDGGKNPEDHDEFRGSICHLNEGKAQFPTEASRYVLYVVAGCPFAARPWIVLSFYGLQDAIPVIKCFPASYEDGWFFSPQSAGEQELVQSFSDASYHTADPYHEDVHHLKQLYEKADANFTGAIAVPLLWDTAKDTAVSNNSLGLAEMLATQMRSLATRHEDVDLFPTDPTERLEHKELVQMLHLKVSTAVYKIHAVTDQGRHDEMVNEYYETLDALSLRIQDKGGLYLMGSQLRFADFVLFISLVRLDLAYQWRFGLGRKCIREDYPVLLDYQRRIFNIPGVAETVLPRDIMALYFMTLKWTQGTAGRTLPQVPVSWQNKVMGQG